MLVLSRKIGEQIVISDTITVTVSRIHGNRVTLGIEAPRDVHILRGELHSAAKEFCTKPQAPPARAPAPLKEIAPDEIASPGCALWSIG